MAKAGDDTNNSQFFITEGPQGHLDFNHTVFGQLIEGESVRDAISEVGGGTTVVIDSATVFTDNENATLLLKAGGPGSTFVTVTATDSQGNSSSQTFFVEGTSDLRNTQPFLSDIPDFMAAAGTTFEFQLEHNDLDLDDIFYFVDSTVPSSVVASVSDSGLGVC